MDNEETSSYATKADLEELKNDFKQLVDTVDKLLQLELAGTRRVYYDSTDGALVPHVTLPNEDKLATKVFEQLENSSRAFEKLQNKYGE